MNIRFESHHPSWKENFENIKLELINVIGFTNPKIEHIGSTSVEGLSAKPIIDILVGLDNENELEKIIAPLLEQGYIYYEVYNVVMPYRRFFVKHHLDFEQLGTPSIIIEQKDIPKNTREHSQRLAHIHVLPYRSEHWIRHIAFRDYLRSHSHIKELYQQLKERLSTQEWADGNEYNKAKDTFLKTEERNAIEWFSRK